MTGNANRARRGRALVASYAEKHGSNDDLRENAIDAVTDVLHALGAENIDPETVAWMAMRHYLGELHEAYVAATKAD